MDRKENYPQQNAEQETYQSVARMLGERIANEMIINGFIEIGQPGTEDGIPILNLFFSLSPEVDQAIEVLTGTAKEEFSQEEIMIMIEDATQNKLKTYF